MKYPKTVEAYLITITVTLIGTAGGPRYVRYGQMAEISLTMGANQVRFSEHSVNKLAIRR